MRLHAGQRIDRYELIEPLGAGGQGSVWKAADLLQQGTLRALKLVPRERATPQAFERARREAHALANASHPALIACHAIFEDIGAGYVGIALDLVEGGPLADVMHDRRMSAAHKHALLEQIAYALAFVHERRLVHRDLKPDNILVADSFWEAPTRPGTVKLVDFGISVEIGNPRPLTATGAVLGTVPYLAPELVAPDLARPTRAPSDEQDYSRDIFAFGVLAAELLLGRHPTGLSLDASLEAYAAAYRQAARGQLPWPPNELTGPWGLAAAMCLRLDPGQRPRTGAELCRVARGEAKSAPQTDLTTASATTEFHTAPMAPPPAPAPRNTVPSRPRSEALRPPQPIIARPPSVPPPPPAIPMASPTPFVVALGVGIVLSGLFAVYMSRDQEETPSAPPILTLPSAKDKVKADPELPALPPLQTAVPNTTQLLPRPEPTASQPMLACPATCCGGKDCATSESNTAKPQLCNKEKASCEPCASKRTCIPWECTEHINPEGQWLLRLAIALEGNVEVQRTNPNAEVCLRPSARPEAPFVCTPVSTSADGRYRTRMPASTTDLHQSGIDVEIRDKNRIIAARRGARWEDKVRVTALCQGLIVRDIVSQRTLFSPRRSFQVTLHLDDPM